MDGRGRLAQSLTRKDGRFLFGNFLSRFSGAALQKFGRVHRLARRWIAPLVELHPPRGAGGIAAAVLLLASAWYGAVKGGHLAEMTAQFHNLCDDLAGAAGLRVSTLTLTGERQLGREDILSQAAITGRTALPCFDAAAARRKLIANPWIAEATVLKLYPGGLRIDIAERAAVALWQKDGAVSVIAADGTVLEPFAAHRFAALPLIVGKGAAFAANDMLTLVGRYPAVRDEVEALVMVAERRWNLRLRNGIDVRLPENDIEAALQTLVRLDREQKVLSRDIVAIDLRQLDRVTVRLSEGAAQAREDAIKELLKDKMPKKKGGSA